MRKLSILDIVPSAATTVTWNMITPAEAMADGDGKILLTSGQPYELHVIRTPVN